MNTAGDNEHTPCTDGGASVTNRDEVYPGDVTRRLSAPR